MRRDRSPKFRSAALAGLVALLMVLLLAPAANATFVIPKPFTMTVTPSTSAAGASAQFTATIKNWWVQKLGSADLSVPAAYSITSVLTSRGTATVVGNTVKLRSLNLAFLHAFTVKVTATRLARRARATCGSRPRRREPPSPARPSCWSRPRPIGRRP